jgi:hypothetical protein
MPSSIMKQFDEKTAERFSVMMLYLWKEKILVSLMFKFISSEGKLLRLTKIYLESIF